MKDKKRTEAYIRVCEDEFTKGGIQSIAIDTFTKR